MSLKFLLGNRKTWARIRAQSKAYFFPQKDFQILQVLFIILSLRVYLSIQNGNLWHFIFPMQKTIYEEFESISCYLVIRSEEFVMPQRYGPEWVVSLMTFRRNGNNENVKHNHTWCVWRVACNLLRALRWHVKFALHHLDSETTSSKRRRQQEVCECTQIQSHQ